MSRYGVAHGHGDAAEIPETGPVATEYGLLSLALSVQQEILQELRGLRADLAAARAKEAGRESDLG